MYFFNFDYLYNVRSVAWNFITVIINNLTIRVFLVRITNKRTIILSIYYTVSIVIIVTSVSCAIVVRVQLVTVGVSGTIVQPVLDTISDDKIKKIWNLFFIYCILNKKKTIIINNNMKNKIFINNMCVIIIIYYYSNIFTLF